jgi:D-lactate dehydrogenase (cytochrome)
MSVVPDECLRDESFYSGNCEIYHSVSSAEELAELLNGDLPVTVQGSRTGICGAAVPEGGCVCDMRAFAGVRVLGEIDGGFCVDALPGTSLEELTAAAEKECGPDGYFFAPDPTERSASIGGLCATNAGGPASLLYGRVAEQVTEADIRLANGELITLKRGEHLFDGNGVLRLPGGLSVELSFPRETPRIPAANIKEGSDALDLFFGSEGALGIFERLRLRLLGKPAARWSLMFFFGEESAAGVFSDAVCDSARSWNGAALSALEYLDVSSLELYASYRARASSMRSVPETPAGLCAVSAELCADSEDLVCEALETLLKIADESGCGERDSWAVSDPVGRERLRLLRHGVPESVNARVGENRRRSASAVKLAADISLPFLSREAALAEIRSLVDSQGLPCAVFGHIGSKAFHVNLLPEDETRPERAEALYDALMKTALSAGGMIAAENGVGKLKRDALSRYLPEDQLELIRAVKNRLDPLGKLNPGNTP